MPQRPQPADTSRTQTEMGLPDLPSEKLQGDPSELHSVDKSEALFTMYLDRSDEDDRKTTEKWKGESDAILIFTGLFSAVLATLLSFAIQGLQPSSQDTSAFYLRNLYHLYANTTSSQPIVYPTPSDPPPFSPPKHAVVVNALWFLSLSMSLTGALLAVFIQQWALNYLQAIQRRHNSRDRARIRAYHEEGLRKLDLYRVTRAVPILIHISLFLFFSGLPVFLFNVNRTVFNAVVTWLALCVAGYACITFMPIFCHDSPYHSPLSSSIWWCVTNTLFIIYQLLSNLYRGSFFLKWYKTHYAGSQLHWPSLRSMQEATARFVLHQPSSDIDYRALKWMFETLNDDKEFEQFFDALPSLWVSTFEDPQKKFIDPNKKILSHALNGMMDRTLLSALVPEDVKQRRIIICTKAIDATSLLEAKPTLHRVLLGDWHGLSRSVHFGLFAQDWGSKSDPVTAFYAQYVVALTLAGVQERDDYWYQLASGQLNVSKPHLRAYFSGDSILLASAIFIIQRTVETFSGSDDHHRTDIAKASKNTLESICRIDIKETLPEHQNLFCGLWNQLVDLANEDTRPHVTLLCKAMLKSTRRLNITLHVGTSSFPTAFFSSTDDDNPVLDDPKSFRRCQMPEHGHHDGVPELQLGERQRNSRTNLDNSMDMIPAMSRPSIRVLPPPFPDIFVEPPSRSQTQSPQASPYVSHTGHLSADDAHWPVSPTISAPALDSSSFVVHHDSSAGQAGYHGQPVLTLPIGQLPPGFVPMTVSSPSQQYSPQMGYSTPSAPTNAAVGSPRMSPRMDPRGLYGVPVPDASSSSGRLSSHNSVRVPVTSTTGESSVMPPANIFSQPNDGMSTSETDADEAVASSIASSNDTLSTPPPSRKKAKPKKAKRPSYDVAPMTPGLVYPSSPLMRVNALASPGPSGTSASQGRRAPAAGMTPASRNRNLTN